MLQVQSVFKVKTLKHSLLTTRKRRKFGCLKLVDTEEAVEEPIAENVSAYLELLQVLMYGYAKAGVKPLDALPAEPEGPGARSTDYVHVPLDVVCCATIAERPGVFAQWRPTLPLPGYSAGCGSSAFGSETRPWDRLLHRSCWSWTTPGR